MLASMADTAARYAPLVNTKHHHDDNIIVPDVNLSISM